MRSIVKAGAEETGALRVGGATVTGTFEVGVTAGDEQAERIKTKKPKVSMRFIKILLFLLMFKVQAATLNRSTQILNNRRFALPHTHA
jgi:hypothetical protein